MSTGDAPGRWRALLLICAGVLGGMTCWFSATAILPELIRDWGLTAGQAGWLTNAVQIGFVLGALVSALLNLPDLVQLTRLIALSALLAAAANSVLLIQPGLAGAVAARFVTGFALAGLYPPAMKLMATWFLRGRGLAMGVLLAGLTLGSSMPHLFRALGDGLDWRMVVIASSLATLAAAAIFGALLHEGPHGFGRARFDPRQTVAVLRNQPILWANMGYFGHTWELYAMWAWFLAFATAAEGQGIAMPFGSASMFAFVVIASGGVGCLLGGVLSDRFGRCLSTAGLMAVSGACAGLIGFAFSGPEWLLAVVAIIWGVTIIGDSAQFSAAVTELAEPRLVGTALTLQVSIGFSLTVLAIWLMPRVAEALGGWQWAFLVVVPGPLIGAWAMLRLRRLPEARQMAGGRR